MTKREYAKYLGDIIDEVIDLDVESDDLRHQFYEYFQAFMPNGTNIEKVFKPIKEGNLYHKRLLQIFNATKGIFNELAAEGKTPAYFCPAPTKNKELLLLYGEKYIENLTLFSKITADQEFIDTMTQIKTVEISDLDVRTNKNDTNAIVYESISDWFIDNTDYEATIEVLSEAYYAINCDYNLSYYFQYPSYKEKINFDVFEPYFKMWEMGYYCWFNQGKLVIGK